MKLFLSTLTVFVALTYPVHCDSSSISDAFRLPRHIEPTLYVIFLEPHFSIGLFNGSVAIELNVKEESDNITLHVKRLDVLSSSVSLKSHDNRSFNVIHSQRVQDEREFYLIRFNETLKVNATYRLTIATFTAAFNIHSDFEGFYLAKYKDEDGVER